MKSVKHKTSNQLFRNRVCVSVVGVGGTGGVLLTQLAKLNMALKALRGADFNLDVNVYDPDHVTRANLGRQVFYECDLGMNKAVAAVNRINLCYGLDWTARPQPFYDGYTSADILIGCVDSRRSRFEIRPGKNRRPCGYYLDCGNSADFGQVLIGDGSRQLPWPDEIAPELFDPELDSDADGPSCSLADALEKQELFVNSFAANIAAQMLWELFRHGGLNYRGVYYNLANMQFAKIPIKDN